MNSHDKFCIIGRVSTDGLIVTPFLFPFRGSIVNKFMLVRYFIYEAKLFFII